MNEVTGVFLQHIPYEIEELDFEGWAWEVFADELRGEDVTIKLYDKPQNDDKKRVATIQGCIGTLEEMQRQARLYPIFYKDVKYVVRLKEDFGEARNSNGFWLNAGSIKIKLQRLALQERKLFKTFCVFRKEFLVDIGYDMYQQTKKGDLNETSVFVSKVYEQEDEEMWNRAGVLVDYSPNGKGSRLRYESVLESMQANRLFNNTIPEGQHSPIKFRSRCGTIESRCNDGIGLGYITENVNEKGIINFIDRTMRRKTTVFFEEFDEFILNQQAIQPNYHGIVSSCPRCKHPYRLIGVSTDLTYLLGKCEGENSCLYDSELNMTDKRKAYCWDGEDFTRLLHQVKYGKTYLQPWLRPTRLTYRDLTAYINITIPLMEDEQKKVNGDEANLSSVSAVVKSIDTSDERVQGFWLSREDVKNFVFEEGSFSRHITIKRQRRVGERNVPVGFEGTIKNSSHDNNNYVYVETPHCPLYKGGLQNRTVRIIPKEDNSGLEKMMKLFTNLLQHQTDPNRYHPVIKTFIRGPSQPEWRIPEMVLDNILLPSVNNGNVTELRRTLRSLLKLNEKQEEAVETAIANTASLLQGPPGTGKTSTGAALAAELAMTERGVVIVATHSNEAADAFATSLDKVVKKINNDGILSKYKDIPKPIRVYAKGRENESLYSSESNSPFRILHQEVFKTSTWQLNELVREVEGHRKEETTKSQHKKLRQLMEKIQIEIVGNCNVFILTTGALSDDRMLHWSSTMGFAITTVIIDEAGQIPHQESFREVKYNAIRTVKIGDHKQLRPVVHSQAAILSGHARSLMEMIYLNGERSTVPKTTLTKQYRMPSIIRKLVSGLSYDNMLEDGEKDNFPFSNKLYTNFPSFKENPILLKRHNGSETQIDRSYRNSKEADVVIDAVNRLLTSSVPHSKITILTMYSGQRELIRSRLNDVIGSPDEKQMLSICNVDGYQGQENEVILLSLVRGNSDGRIGFLEEFNRINVAISRARSFLIVALNPTTIGSCKLVNEYFLTPLLEAGFKD